MLIASQAPKLTNYYVWLDFGCINQDGNPAGELKQLDKIVQCCDLIFTPIAGNDAWIFPSTGITNYLSQYKAKGWITDKFGYVNRGWCRLEMFYASNIPLHSDSATKLSKFKNGLNTHALAGRRPHFLYGQREVRMGLPPLCLPPLQNSYFQEFHPEQGYLSVAEDKAKISQLVAELLPHMKQISVGFQGKYKNGKRSGRGVYRFANGDVYDGWWQNDKKHGQGVFRFASGDVYDGTWVNDKRNGHGVLTFADGNVYEGEYKDGRWNGHGISRYVNGNVYEGQYKNGKKNGHGIFRYANGDEYNGEWDSDRMHGYGVFRYANGEIHNGIWQNGKKIRNITSSANDTSAKTIHSRTEESIPRKKMKLKG